MTTVDSALRALLICPLCRGELEDRERGLLCRKDALLFPVVEGVPFLVKEEALKPTEAELNE